MAHLVGVLIWSLVGFPMAYGGIELHRGRVGEGLSLLLLSAIAIMIMKLGNDVMERLDSLERKG